MTCTLLATRLARKSSDKSIRPNIAMQKNEETSRQSSNRPLQGRDIPPLLPQARVCVLLTQVKEMTAAVLAVVSIFLTFLSAP